MCLLCRRRPRKGSLLRRMNQPLLEAGKSPTSASRTEEVLYLCLDIKIPKWIPVFVNGELPFLGISFLFIGEPDPLFSGETQSFGIRSNFCSCSKLLFDKNTNISICDLSLQIPKLVFPILVPTHLHHRVFISIFTAATSSAYFNQEVIKRALALIWLLDQAKVKEILPHNPCLFNVSAPVKVSS